jgi:hypothetical protein
MPTSGRAGRGVTVIAGIVADDGTIYMAGDSSCTTTSGKQYILAAPKVFLLGGFLIGCCGAPRIADVLRFHFTPPKHARGVDVQRYMRLAFVDAYREALKKAGALHVMNAVESAVESAVLVGYRRRLFEIDDDFTVTEVSDNFFAMGSGGQVARGALYASKDTPRKRLLAALAAAERFESSVRRPFTVLAMEPK